MYTSPGETDLGRTYMLLNYLRPQARKAPTPPDIIYVHNFADPDRPLLFALPAGQGKKLKQSLKELVDAVVKELLTALRPAPMSSAAPSLWTSFRQHAWGFCAK